MISFLRIAFRTLLFTSLILLTGCATVGETAAVQQDKPYLVLVSFDGFRWDYPQLTDTPTLDRMARDGLKAEALKPAFPTITFPNHFSIATGVQPWRHGIVANSFPNEDGSAWYDMKDREAVMDGGWYLVDPIWVTAEKSGMHSAAFYFVGTEADVGGVRPSYWRPFDASVANGARVSQVLDWLAEPEDTRPHLLTLYFEEVDDHAHWYGPESAENRAAIRELDSQLGELLEGISLLPHGDRVYVVVVSDHGQGRYATDREPFILEDWFDLDGTRVVNGGPYAFVHFEHGAAERATHMRDVINRNWDCGKAYLPGDLPPEWEAGTSDRYPGLFVIADRGCAVLTRKSGRDKLLSGDHGWAPEVSDMSGILYAIGPRIPAGSRVGMVHVTDVYPMMLDILGLESPGPLHGDPLTLASLLLPEKE